MSELGEPLHDLHQMLVRHVHPISNLVHRNAPLRLKAERDKTAQCVVGESGKSHE
jgi:hypothetical protein